ncbi:MAG TPA: bifunctional YncE family protein/alkaline phosphatase family protein [Candidatus Acidoferrum sp.]
MPAGIRIFSVLLCEFLFLAAGSSQEQERTRLPDSKTVLRPTPGAPQRTNGFPETIALSPDGRYAALLNNGYGTAETGVKQSIAVLDLHTNLVTDFPEDRLAENAHQSYFIGLAFGSDGLRLYASIGSISDPTGELPGNTGNGIAVYRFEQGKIVYDRFLKVALQPIPPGTHVASDLSEVPPGRAIPYPAGIAVVPYAGKDRLLVANNLSDNVVLLDAESGNELAHFDLGTHRFVPATFPYTVVASRDGRRAWCSLWNASQVAELDLQRHSVLRRINVFLPKSPVAPGSHPTALLLSPDEKILYVALANADSVAVIDTRTARVRAFLSTRLPKQEFSGNETDALAQSADGTRLFAASAATDSVAVFDTAQLSKPQQRPGAPLAALGFIPTEWYTLAVSVAGNDLLITSGKGLGTGPNGNIVLEQPSATNKTYPYIATLLHGSLARIKLDEVEKNLSAFTRTAQEQMQLLAGPASLPFANGANPLHHVIYIIKENRTYDQILGDLQVGDGDPALTLYGADITPNEHKLALQFGVLDNFYDSGEVSGNGHTWSTAAISSDYNEKTWQIAYRSKERTYDYEGLVADESPLEHDEPDVNEPGTGYLWGNVARHKLSYRHYGEFVASEWCGIKSGTQSSPKQGTPSTKETCAKNSIKQGEPLPAAPGESAGPPSPYPWPVPVLRRDVATKPELRGHFDPRYADFEVDYPDQLRVDEFLREFKGFVRARERHSKAQELPSYVMLRLPNDHTGGTRPGFATPSASVADNDLAVGRVAEAVSHSPYWEDTAIFIVEDDAQDGADHVDAHRSIALLISKYAPGSTAAPHVEHGFFTTVSLVRTMEALLGLPPMNHNDAYAPVMSPLFSGAGNQPAFDADDRNLKNGLIYQTNAATAAGAKASAAMNWRHADEANNEVLNEILWRDRKGNAPMPESRHTIFPE